MTDHAHKFTANYANGSVTLAGKSFPAGQFVVDAMNAWTAIDFPLQSGVWEKVLQSELAHGRIDEQLFCKAKDDVRICCREICRIPPYSDLCNAGEELQLIERAFDERNLNAYRTIASEHILFGDGEHISAAEHEAYRNLIALLPFYGDLKAEWESVGSFAEEWQMDLDAVKQEDVQRLAAKYAEREHIVESKRRISADGTLSFDRIFRSFGALFMTDFLEGLQHGHYPKRCENCGRWFLVTDGIHRRYCDGIAPNDPKHRPCRKVAAVNRAKESAKAHPVKQLCTARLTTIRKHKARQKLTEQQAQHAKRYAMDCRDRAIADHRYAVGQYAADMELSAIYAAIGK